MSTLSIFGGFLSIFRTSPPARCPAHPIGRKDETNVNQSFIPLALAIQAQALRLALLKARLSPATVQALAAGKWSADLARRITADLSVSHQA